MKTWWRRQNELDDYQKAAIQLPVDGNYLVSGPPGSGKTNILVLRAQYISSAGLGNVNLIVYPRVLKEFIATGCGDSINFPAEQVYTLSKWMRDMITERGFPLPDDLNDMGEEESRAALLERLQEAMDGLRDDYFDSLIVDEIQDFKEEEIAVLSCLTRRLFLSGDQRQRIYSQGNGLQAVRNSTELLSAPEVVLPFHYRIGPKICEAADRIRVDDAAPLSETENYQNPEFPSRVDLHHHQNLESQCAAMAETIKTQIRTYGGDFIGILAFRNDEANFVYDYLSNTELADKIKVFTQGNDRSFDPDLPVCIMTLHSAKGTEFRAVHWAAANIVPHYTRERAFTLITRAKTSLDVYYSGNIRPELQTAFSERQAPSIGLPE